MIETKKILMPKLDNVGSGGNSIEKRQKINMKTAKRQTPKLPQFKGKFEPFYSDIFSHTAPHRTDNYVKTQKEIYKHTRRSYKYGADIRRSLESLQKLDLTKLRTEKSEDYEVT